MTIDVSRALGNGGRDPSKQNVKLCIFICVFSDCIERVDKTKCFNITHLGNASWRALIQECCLPSTDAFGCGRNG